MEPLKYENYYSAFIYRLWGLLHKWNWYIDFTIISRSLPTGPRLHLYCLTANWNLFEVHRYRHGHQLPWLGIRLSSDKWWKIRRLSTDGEILWRWGQHAWIHANNSKPFKAEVSRNCNRDCFEIIYIKNNLFTGSHLTTLETDLDLRLGMRPLMRLHWPPTEEELVVATSQLWMASWHRHHTQKSTRKMQIASTPSRSQIPLI